MASLPTKDSRFLVTIPEGPLSTDFWGKEGVWLTEQQALQVYDNLQHSRNHVHFYELTNGIIGERKLKTTRTFV